MRYFLELSYDGSAYHGWQNQPNAISVQEVLEMALIKLLNETIAIFGAGRTDTGVHAVQMFAHFDVNQKLDVNDLSYKLNALLPKDISVSKIFEVKADAHARFDALSRTYHYRISTIKDVFGFRYSYRVQQPLDLDKMNEACKILLDYKDFQCFSKSKTDVKTYYCDIREARWTKKGNSLMFVITADRFLRNMVRAVVGTMITIGLGKMQPKDLHDIIRSKDRGQAGFSVPAHGLYLVKIVYPKTVVV